MTDQLPEFNNDDELEAWFDEARLESYELEEVDVEIASPLRLILEGPWHVVRSGSATTSTSGEVISRTGELRDPIPA